MRSEIDADFDALCSARAALNRFLTGHKGSVLCFKHSKRPWFRNLVSEPEVDEEYILEPPRSLRVAQQSPDSATADAVRPGRRSVVSVPADDVFFVVVHEELRARVEPNHDGEVGPVVAIRDVAEIPSPNADNRPFVDRVCARILAGERAVLLAVEFGVKVRAVYAIKYGETWAKSSPASETEVAL